MIRTIILLSFYYQVQDQTVRYIVFGKVVVHTHKKLAFK